MSGKTLTAQDIEAPDQPKATKGLRDRLNSHYGGDRSGDKFCIYICDRFIVPQLSQEQLDQLRQTRLRGRKLLLDQLTQDLIRKSLSYRFVYTRDGEEARQLESGVQRGKLPTGRRPLLNPLEG